MSRPKKGQLTQFMFPLRSSSDGSVASTVTESDFNSGATVKFFGVNHGTSAAFTSGTVSKTGRLVRSGVFQICLKGSENNYDEMIVRVNKTSAREAIIAWNNVDYDDSDTYSLLSDLQSDFQSRVPKAVATNSQLSDLHSDLRSYLVANSGVLSDVYSALSDLQSDFQSRVPKRVATDSQLSDMASDIKSAVTIVQSMASDAASAAQQCNSRVLVVQSMASDTYSNLSDLKSDFQSRVPKAVATNSQLSDLHSDLRSYLVAMSGVQSDVYSLLSDLQSDFQSRVPKRVATDSQLSDVSSDLRSVIGGITVSISASDVSDIASAVVAALPITSAVSDIYSLLSDLQSDFQSRVPKRVATDSQLSDLASDLKSYMAGVSDQVSNVYSLLVAGPEIGASSMSDLRSAVLANGMLAAGADPTGVVGVTDTLAAKVDWLTAMSRNKLTQTGSSAVLFNDAGTAVASATVSDDGTTYTRDEWH